MGPEKPHHNPPGGIALIRDSRTGSGSTTARHTPKALDKIDADRCAKVMTLGEANKIMEANAANVRVLDSTDEDGVGGSCNYETSPFQAAVFVVVFANANAGSIDPAAEISSNPEFKGAVTPVSGLGDKPSSSSIPLRGQASRSITSSSWRARCSSTP
jgi:hypothetical protein